MGDIKKHETYRTGFDLDNARNAAAQLFVSATITARELIRKGVDEESALGAIGICERLGGAMAAFCADPSPKRAATMVGVCAVLYDAENFDAVQADILVFVNSIAAMNEFREARGKLWNS